MLKRCLILFLLLPLTVFAEEFVAGKDYQLLSTATPAKNTVVEFFSYGCPWCFRLEPTINTWAKEHPGIKFSRVPVVFNKSWTYYAKAFYTANTLGKEAEITPLLFKAVQTDKLNLTHDDTMSEFLVKQGLDPAVVKSAFADSPTMDLYMKEGMATMAKYQISAVPAFVVNGQYKTDLEMAKSEQRLVAILNYLLSK